MENRSFDHILGWLKPTRPENRRINRKESNPLNASDPNSEKNLRIKRRRFRRHGSGPLVPSHPRADIRIQRHLRRPENERVRPGGGEHGARDGKERHERVQTRVLPVYTS
ncbi:Uncharacterized protein Rs2_00812 [Raphanus sativus]|nr:Uncharacterized protein Rs2_00812 [Raphanus sativus]